MVHASLSSTFWLEHHGPRAVKNLEVPRWAARSPIANQSVSEKMPPVSDTAVSIFPFPYISPYDTKILPGFHLVSHFLFHFDSIFHYPK